MELLGWLSNRLLLIAISPLVPSLYADDLHQTRKRTGFEGGGEPSPEAITFQTLMPFHNDILLPTYSLVTELQLPLLVEVLLLI